MMRFLEDTDRGRLSKEKDQGMRVGMASEVQDEVLRKKCRTTPNESD